MGLKIRFVFLLLFIAGAVFLFKTENLTLNSSSAGTEKRKGQTTGNRSVKIGQAQFIEGDKALLPKIQQYIKSQWALKDIEFLKAWKILEKEKKVKKPLVIAVVDTGIHTQHPCLKNSLWKNPGEIPNNGKDDDKNGFVDDVHGWNFVDNNNDIQDYHGHGTHVSGIIAAQGATPQFPNCKIMGVAPYSRIMTLKYYDEKAQNSSNIENTARSIEYAVQNGADIINYSGGGPGKNMAEQSSIARAADKNIIFVAALGNEGSEIGKKIKYYPASYKLPNILFVLSKNKEEIIRSSNRVKFEPLENKQTQNAPGENIISTLPPRIYLQSRLKPKAFRKLASYKKVHHDNYGRMTGTSQATAVATGVVALVKTLYPSYSMRKVISQVDKTGFGQGTEKIKEATNQGKKLSAYEALIMRDKNVNLTDQIDRTVVEESRHDPKDPNKDLREPKDSQYNILRQIGHKNKTKAKK